MDLLILGGTRFVGRHVVEIALGRGHTVTLFNRGESNADLFPSIEKLTGDRDGNLAALKGRQWDAVIDTCGYVPRLVHDSAQMLASAVNHYTFISTISVYGDFSQIGIDENSAVATIEDETIEDITGGSYGALKALCEQAAENAMPGKVLNVRCGLIVGPYDQSDRFTYWVDRVACGGEILAPDSPNAPVQFIDVRDLGAWTLDMVESNQTGIYNATNPKDTLTIQDVLDTCQTESHSDAQFTWVGESLLLENDVAPFTEIPLWLPTSAAGGARINTEKAIARNLQIRPLAETIRDTLEWHRTRPDDYELKAGLKPEREKELLQLWHKSKN